MNVDETVRILVTISDRTTEYLRQSGDFDIEFVSYQMNGKNFTVVCVGKLEDDSTIINYAKDSYAYSWFTSGHGNTPKFKTWEEVIAYASSPEDGRCPHYLVVKTMFE